MQNFFFDFIDFAKKKLDLFNSTRKRFINAIYIALVSIYYLKRSNSV